MSGVLSNGVGCLLRATDIHLNIVQAFLHAVELVILLLQPLQNRPPDFLGLRRLLLRPRQTQLQNTNA